MGSDGWYVDGVLSGGHYAGDVQAPGHGNVGAVVANGRDLSVEVGRSITLANGMAIEPEAQLLGQSFQIKHRVDADGIDLRSGNVSAWTTRVGARLTMPVRTTTSWAPYADLQLQRAWMNAPSIDLSGQGFEEGSAGSAVRLGVGASGRINSRWSLYGEFDTQRRLGSHGFNNLSANVGVRYDF